MKVALGTIEIDEEDRRVIKLALGFRGGKASRHEARQFVLDAARARIDELHVPDPEVAIAAAEKEGER